MYESHLRWTRATPDFTYDTYDRTHVLRLGSGTTLDAAAAPEYKGDASKANPEELLVAALSSCHMLSFLAIAARKRLTVDSYTDHARGSMSKNDKGKLWVSEVTLTPHVVFALPVTQETLDALHAQAHAECFIASSVKTAITIAARVIDTP